MSREDADFTVNVPVARLPPETLTHVFSILSSIDRPRIKVLLKENQVDLGWLKVTHVCQRWRNIALNQPLLWASNIVLPSLLGDLWAATFVTRAQDVPLTVNCFVQVSYRKDSPSNTPFIGTNLMRTCAIVGLRTSSHHLQELCTPAPVLHTLDLSVFSISEVLLLPEGLFGGAVGLPELRHLSVESSGVLSWTPLLLQQLVSVDLTVAHVEVPGAKLAPMLAALGRMPGLERLKLSLTPQDINEVPVTQLPALQHLSLRNVYVKAALLVLHCLGLPAGVRIHFAMHMEYIPAPGLSTVFPKMNARIGDRTAAISRVYVKVAAGDRRRVGPRGVEVCAWREDTEGAPSLAVRFFGWKHVPAVLKSLASTHLEALAVGGDPPDVSDAAWLDALGSAPRLRRVTVQGSAVPQFCATPHGPDVLPALSVLVVNIRSHLSAKTILEDKLPRCLAERVRAGNVLKELEVVGYDEDEDCVRALQEAVPGLVIRWSQREVEQSVSTA